MRSHSIRAKKVLWTILLSVVLGTAATSCSRLGLPSPLTPKPEKVTFESLLTQMTDLEELTRLPNPAYTCKQFSSYDPRSTDPKALTDENWFANGDRGQHLRKETRNGREEWVMMDAKGPGAIVRVWSANANDAGTLRVYLDGAEEPAIEMPLQDMLKGKTFPFPSPIAGVRGRGWNAFLPIPYGRSCKVTADKKSFYYQVNYRTYEEGTEVETFSIDLAKKHEAAIRATAKLLAKPGQTPLKGSSWIVSSEKKIAPGATVLLSKIERPAPILRMIKRPAAIMRIECSMPDVKDQEAAARGCLLDIRFDDEKTPSVLAPLGDFFGTAPGISPYASLPSGATQDGLLYSNWIMPFAKQATLSVTNHTTATVTLKWKVVSAPYNWTDDSLLFHAKWRQERDIPTRPRQDWTYLAAQGQGRFVGDMLHISNPVQAWWGEGDEKIYVDGEKFPSHFGTGTEDYYGYAWCDTAVFTHAYHNQPRCDGPRNFGHSCVSRFHILDNIPFNSDFRFDMEVWHWADTRVSMATTSYWYARPGGSDDIPAPKPAELTVPTLPEMKRVKGAIEGEKLQKIGTSKGKAAPQGGSIADWSAGAQLWWIGAKPGDTLKLAVPVKKAGRYEAIAVFTKAVDYGIVELTFAGKKIKGELDLFNRGVIATPERSLGVFDLKAGDNTLEVKILGTHPDAVKKYMFGLDYLLLKPAK